MMGEDFTFVASVIGVSTHKKQSRRLEWTFSSRFLSSIFVSIFDSHLGKIHLSDSLWCLYFNR